MKNSTAQHQYVGARGNLKSLNVEEAAICEAIKHWEQEPYMAWICNCSYSGPLKLFVASKGASQACLRVGLIGPCHNENYVALSIFPHLVDNAIHDHVSNAVDLSLWRLLTNHYLTIREFWDSSGIPVWEKKFSDPLQAFRSKMVSNQMRTAESPTNSKLSFQACFPPLFKLIPSFMQACKIHQGLLTSHSLSITKGWEVEKETGPWIVEIRLSLSLRGSWHLSFFPLTSWWLGKGLTNEETQTLAVRVMEKIKINVQHLHRECLPQ